MNVVQVNSAQISCSVRRKLLVAEISDLGNVRFQRLYSDACDVGFALRNPKTGNVTRWAVQQEIRDPRENELLGWMMVPTPETVQRQPMLKGYQLNLVND
jgi:hypothetical protein